jgi:ABC-2 type transport system ATP-binding protein
VRLAGAIVHDPRLLILDEPMTGLDPLGRKSVIDLIRARAKNGRAVVFSSHILHEVEAVANYVIVLNKGMVLAEGTLEHIREALSDYAFTIEIVGSNLVPLAQTLVALDHVTSVEWISRKILKVSSESARALSLALPALVLDLHADVQSLTTPDESLDALFSRLVARRPG